MIDRIALTLSSIARVLRAVLGAPDYSRYVKHMRAAHPERSFMSREDFYRDRFESRYNKPGAKCC